MTRVRIATVLGLLAFALPAFVAAQGLGDAAARERAKREAAKKAGETKVFTNEDLDQGRPPGAPPAEGAASSSTPSPPQNVSEESAPEVDQRAQEQPYIDTVTAARSRVAQIEARIQELQAKLNPMSTTFIYGDLNALGGDKVAEEAEVKAELAQAESELNAARQAVVDATRAYQGSRQGRPPGAPVPR